MKFLKCLMDEIPGNEQLFVVIIDSLSRLSGDAEEEGEAIRRIFRLVRRSAAPLVKVLLTDLLPDHMAHLSAVGDELYIRAGSCRRRRLGAEHGVLARGV